MNLVERYDIVLGKHEEFIILPKIGEKIFVSEGGYYDFAHFGWGQTGMQFHSYMQGYISSASILVDKVTEEKRIENIDTYVFPICFLYRQYLELIMKYIYMKHAGDHKKKIISTINDVNHDLFKVWQIIKPIIEVTNACFEEECDLIQAVEGYISEFNQFDSNSVTFRYPITKRMEKVLSQEFYINLKILQTRMEELYNFFEGCLMQLDDLKESNPDAIVDDLDY